MGKIKLEKGDEVYKFKYLPIKGKKVDRLIITKAKKLDLSRYINNEVLTGNKAPRTGRFMLSPITSGRARFLIQRSKSSSRVLHKKIGKFKSSSRSI